MAFFVTHPVHVQTNFVSFLEAKASPNFWKLVESWHMSVRGLQRNIILIYQKFYFKKLLGLSEGMNLASRLVTFTIEVEI